MFFYEDDTLKKAIDAEDGEEVIEEVVDVYNVDADFDLDGEVNDEE